MALGGELAVQLAIDNQQQRLHHDDRPEPEFLSAREANDGEPRPYQRGAPESSTGGEPEQMKGIGSPGATEWRSANPVIQNPERTVGNRRVQRHVTACTEPFPGFGGFAYRAALPYEEGVSRRDPSPVVRGGGCYYVWYSRSTRDASGYWATIWYAISADGLHWQERGQALGRGDAPNLQFGFGGSLEY